VDFCVKEETTMMVKEPGESDEGWLYEEDLKRIVCLHPELIEDGLTIEHEEYPVRTPNTTYRCDLKARDREGQLVFIELKLHAGQTVVFQIAKYRAFLKEQGRFVVAAFAFDTHVDTVLKDMGFECVHLNADKVEELLDKERSNPALYLRRTAVLPRLPGLRKTSYRHQYTDSERETVDSFMKNLRRFILDSGGLPQGVEVLGDVDVRRSDEYRILMSVPNSPSDRFVIYVRARKMNEIHLSFVPDFSFSTSGSPRKDAFKEFVTDSRKGDIESVFGLSFRRPSRGNDFGDWLEITAQAWKGLSGVIARPLESWKNPDFVEIVGVAMLDFVETVMPFVNDFFKLRGEVSTR